MNDEPERIEDEDIIDVCPDCKGYGVIYFNEETDTWIDKRTFFVLGDLKGFEEQRCDKCDECECDGEGVVDKVVDERCNFTYGLDRRDRSFAGLVNERLRVRSLMFG